MNGDQQLAFWDRPTPRLQMPEPLARNSDPEPSHVAAAAVRERAMSQSEEILALIRHYPGSTGGELVKVWKSCRKEKSWKRTTIGRRTSGLKDKGFIRYGASRICTVSGSLETTYYPV